MTTMMTLRTAAMATASLAVLVGLAACNPAKVGEARARADARPMVVATRLDCPSRQGELSRIEAAPDGRSCRYTGEDGQTVTLQLIALNGRTAQGALSDLEAELKGSLPSAVAGAARGDASDDAETNDGDDDDSRRTAGVNIVDNGEKTHIDAPGFHIHADGGKAEINLPGIHINADDATDKADVEVSGPFGKIASVHAGDGGAEVRTGSITASSVDSLYVLASDKPGPGGERAAGYVARGPTSGPLVVGVSRMSGESHNPTDRLRDVRRLVVRNAKRT